MTARHVAISILWLATLGLFWPPISAAVQLGLSDDRYVQILASPLICAFLVYLDRKRIFEEAAWAPVAGILLLLLVLVYFVTERGRSYSNDSVAFSLAVLTVILVWMAAFILCYGLPSFRAAVFPLCCLLLIVPVPGSLMDKLATALQHGSAAVSCEMLRLVGVPVFAQGTRLSLPGLEIEVAPECSGIRSFLSLALVSLVAGRVFLSRGWNRLALVVSTIPIAILKNALRISVIVWLGEYVNRAFLHGPIHRYGGLVFTPLGAAALLGLLAGLRRSEAWMARRRQAARPIEEAPAVRPAR